LKASTEPTASQTPPSSRLGLVFFLIYLLFYAGFVLISAFASQWLELRVLGGLNLAIVYGFGLIALALMLASLYGWLRRGDA
jgi:uncharacterized membrane protein (DUF485 family)